MLSLLMSVAAAEPPDRQVATLGDASSAAEHLSLSDDGTVLAYSAGSVGWFLDTQRWALASTADCAVRGAGAGPATAAGVEVWVGCDDGTIRGFELVGGALSPLTDEAGAARVVTVGSVDIMGLWHEPASGVWYLLEGETSLLDLHSFDPVGDTVDGQAGYPLQLPFDGYVDATVSNGTLYVAHGGDDVSRMLLGASAATANVTPFAISIDDIAASPSGGVYAVDGAGVLAEHSSVGQYVVLASGLGAPSAVGADADDGWLVVAGEGGAEAWELSGSALVGTEPITAFDLDDSVVDLVAAGGYAFGGTASVGVAILTANPWVSGLVASPTKVTEGTVVTVSFESDTAGAFGVFLGGGPTGSGDLLAAGEAVEGPQSVDVTVGSGWAEGDADLWVLVTDPSLNIGYAATTVTVDNPPEALNLDPDALGFGDEALILRFDGATDEDLSSYAVYVTTEAFTAKDWSEGGGPSYAGPDDIVAPIEVPAVPEEQVEVYIGPLTNYVTYYVSVRAVDTSGLEGPMSPVLTESPRPTYGAADLAGEPGGINCDTSGARGGVLLGVAALFVAGRRRRAVGAVLAAAVVAPGVAAAEPRDLTPARGSFEVAVGTFDYSDANIEKVYGDGVARSVHVEAGPQLLRFLEIDLGVGFTQATGTTVDENGLQSAEFTNLTVVPLSLGATGRLHIIDDQLLVPYAGIGVDAFFWRESWDAGFGVKERVVGTKRGSHLTAGIDLMLDPFAPGRASLLEAQTGINDSYVVFEWRKQVNGVDSGLSLSGQTLLIGLKLDY